MAKFKTTQAERDWFCHWCEKETAQEAFDKFLKIYKEEGLKIENLEENLQELMRRLPIEGKINE